MDNMIDLEALPEPLDRPLVAGGIGNKPRPFYVSKWDMGKTTPFPKDEKGVQHNISQLSPAHDGHTQDSLSKWHHQRKIMDLFLKLQLCLVLQCFYSRFQLIVKLSGCSFTVLDLLSRLVLRPQQAAESPLRTHWTLTCSAPNGERTQKATSWWTQWSV